MGQILEVEIQRDPSDDHNLRVALRCIEWFQVGDGEGGEVSEHHSIFESWQPIGNKRRTQFELPTGRTPTYVGLRTAIHWEVCIAEISNHEPDRAGSVRYPLVTLPEPG